MTGEKRKINLTPEQLVSLARKVIYWHDSSLDGREDFWGDLGNAYLGVSESRFLWMKTYAVRICGKDKSERPSDAGNPLFRSYDQNACREVYLICESSVNNDSNKREMEMRAEETGARQKAEECLEKLLGE